MSQDHGSTGDRVPPEPEPEPQPEPDGHQKPEPEPPEKKEKDSKTVVGVTTTFQSAQIEHLHLNDASAAPTLKRTVGRLDEQDIRRLLRNFVTPLSYPDALEALSTDHVVVIEGRVGDGRHAAAVSLLGELTDERLNMLTPIMSLADLAGHDYEAGQGFIVVDRIVERETAETEFVWHTVRDRVRNCAAYLVITSASTSTSAVEAVRHVRWRRPDLDRVLRAHLPGFDDDRLAEIIAQIPDSWRMADVAYMCERLAAGDPDEQALETFGAAARQRVGEWFAEERPLREVLAMATLSFATGVNRRDFDRHLAQLEEEVRERGGVDEPVPGEERAAGTAVRVLPARRKELLGESSLIMEKRTQVGLKARNALVFRSPGYRRWVLDRLSQNYDNLLWDAVRAWIDDNLLVLDRYELAYGLALLAEIDYDEVEGSYLVPWSVGDRGWPGQVAATWVLWLMCRDDTLSRLALRTATRWAAEGTPAQRWTAAIAFSGELGRLFPADALKRLWNLTVQSRDDDPSPRFALAGLFSYMVGTDGNAHVILAMLKKHLHKFAKSDLRLYRLTMASIIEVLAVWDYEVQQPSVFRLLRRQPERLELVISLWAYPLRHNYFRKEAVEALVKGIKSLEKVSDDPERDVAEIGQALADALTPEDQTMLLHGIQALNNRTRDRASVLDALLQALTNTLRNQKARQAR